MFLTVLKVDVSGFFKRTRVLGGNVHPLQVPNTKAQVNMEQGFLTHIDPKLDTCLAKPTYSQFYAKLNIDMSIRY